jgi:hypothetical protein
MNSLSAGVYTAMVRIVYWEAHFSTVVEEDLGPERGDRRQAELRRGASSHDRACPTRLRVHLRADDDADR